MRVKVTVVVGRKDKTWYEEEVELVLPAGELPGQAALDVITDRLKKDEKAAKATAFLAIKNVNYLEEKTHEDVDEAGKDPGGERGAV